MDAYIERQTNGQTVGQTDIDRKREQETYSARKTVGHAAAGGGGCV